MFLTELKLEPGTIVYPTVRAINAARLVSECASTEVYISPTSSITVKDGLCLVDINYQNDVSSISGQFDMMYPCPIIQCQWHIEDITGRRITNATVCYNNEFQNDELQLENFHTYIVFVDAIDAVNRTLKGKSNGVMTVIEPPYPGAVRDGLYQDEDWDFQESTTQLSFNWDAFGSDDTWQEIAYYEVAIGDDPSYDTTRTNIHYFVNVGLNQSFTFHNLNLTEHTVTYYGTVRGYSVSNAFVDSTSSGIKVGYEEVITSGHVYVPSFTGSLNSLMVSWDSFVSDFALQRYLWGIGREAFSLTNKTISCERLIKRLRTWSREMPLKDTGLNTIDEVNNLQLQQGEFYFVTILGEATGDLCTAAESVRFRVDITPPVLGQIQVAGLSNVAQYMTSPDYISISLDGFYDQESFLNNIAIQLLRYDSCSDTSSYVPLSDIIDIGHARRYTFLGLELEPNIQYFISLEAFNNANSTSSMMSQAIFLDVSSPVLGSVYAGTEFTNPIYYQSSTEDVYGTLAVTPYEFTNCSQYDEVIPGNLDEIRVVNNRKIYHLNTPRKPRNHFMTYNAWNIEGTAQGNIDMRIHTNISTHILDSSMVVIDDTNVLEGAFTLKTRIDKTSVDEPVILSFSLLERLYQEHVEFELPEVQEELSDEEFMAQGELIVNEIVTENPNATDIPYLTTVDDLNEFPNTTNVSNTDSFASKGVGFHILAFPLGNKTQAWKIMLWARGFDGVKTVWGDLPGDPSLSEFTYDLSMKHLSENYWQVALSVEDKIIGILESIELLDEMSLAFRLWTHDEVVPPITNPFHPFQCTSTISALYLPIAKSKLCHYGSAFHDVESGLHSFEVTLVSPNYLNLTSNIEHIDICHPCMTECDAWKCTEDCSWILEDYYNIQDIHIGGLSLSPGIYFTNEHNEEQFLPFLYHLQVEAFNEAGLSIITHSNWLRVDTTPAKITFLHASDPDYVSESPAEFQGSNTSLSAFWEFNDVESPLVEYIIAIGTAPGRTDIVEPTSVGLDTQVIIDGLEGIIQYGTRYFVTVTGRNAAGLNTTGSTAGITPSHEEPKMENVTVKALENDTAVTWNGSLTFFTRRSDMVALSLDGVDASNLDMLGKFLTHGHL